jgi:hypothetical protein
MTNNNENKDRDRRARQILDEARETLARQPQPYLAPAEPLRYRTTYKPEPEPEPPKLDIAPAPPPMDWWAAIDQRIEQHVEAERGFVLAVVGEALGEALADAREEHHKALAMRARSIRKNSTNKRSNSRLGSTVWKTPSASLRRPSTRRSSTCQRCRCRGAT